MLTQEWKLESGDENHLGVGIYGEQGVSSIDDTPDSLELSTCWQLDQTTLFVGFGRDDQTDEYDSMWSYEAKVEAIGDPHITSMWGCSFEADKTKTEAVLMKCEKDELRIRDNEDWSYHIYQVVTIIDGRKDRYHHETLKHGQVKTICRNKIEFHRYYLGINLRIVEMRNHNVSGLFNDSRCLETLIHA